jgi:hypothetical protein
MNTSLNIYTHGQALSFEARSNKASGAIWLELTIRTESGYFELTCFNSTNEVGLAALAQAINQVNAAHFAAKEPAL